VAVPEDLDVFANLVCLQVDLLLMVVRRPLGSAQADGHIASTLSVAALPYTSNDADAQTLLPAGWSWGGTYPSGMHYAVRASDGQRTLEHPGYPSPLSRCIAAVNARVLDEERARHIHLATRTTVDAERGR
jgi:hypothetical protein